MRLTVDGADFAKGEVWESMAKLSLEKATQGIAEMARDFANKLEDGPPVDGPTALRAFAASILATNEVVFPPKGEA